MADGAEPKADDLAVPKLLEPPNKLNGVGLTDCDN